MTEITKYYVKVVPHGDELGKGCRPPHPAVFWLLLAIFFGCYRPAWKKRDCFDCLSSLSLVLFPATAGGCFQFKMNLRLYVTYSALKSRGAKGTADSWLTWIRSTDTWLQMNANVALSLLDTEQQISNCSLSCLPYQLYTVVFTACCTAPKWPKISLLRFKLKVLKFTIMLHREYFVFSELHNIQCIIKAPSPFWLV